MPRFRAVGALFGVTFLFLSVVLIVVMIGTHDYRARRPAVLITAALGVALLVVSAGPRRGRDEASTMLVGVLAIVGELILSVTPFAAIAFATQQRDHRLVGTVLVVGILGGVGLLAMLPAQRRRRRPRAKAGERDSLLAQLRYFRFVPAVHAGIADREEELTAWFGADTFAETLAVMRTLGVTPTIWPEDRPRPAFAKPYVDPDYLSAPSFVTAYPTLAQPGLVTLCGSTGFVHIEPGHVVVDLVDVRTREVTTATVHAALRVERSIFPRLRDRWAPRP